MKACIILGLAGLIAIAGCSGGASPPATPQAVASPKPTSSASGPTSAGTLLIVINRSSSPSPSSASRRPKYVSPSSESVSIVVNGGSPSYADVSPSSPNCTTVASVSTCSIPIFAPAGPATIALSFYDAYYGTGNLLGTGTGSTTVTYGTPFTVTIPIIPVVGALSFGSFSGGFVVGSPATTTVPVTAEDADFNIIPSSVTAFAGPVTITGNDPNVTVTPASWTGPTPQTFSFTYNGNATPMTPVTFQFTVGSVFVGSVSFFNPQVSTVAGSGTEGFLDGAAASADFNYPVGVAIDTSGNIYVADYYNERIRKITTGGVVSTLAGDGAQGANDGPGATATFYYPNGLAVDSAGNVYVADSFNYKVRKITPGGVVSTLAGTGASGSADGPGASATFNAPSSVAVDSAGNVYVTDYFDNKIRMITPGGTVSTLAGTGAAGSLDGPELSATFNGPEAIAVDSAGNLYVADYNDDKIRMISAGGTVSTIAGSGTQGNANGPAASATFYNPNGIAVDSHGFVYVGDYGNNVIREIRGGVVTTYAGTGQAGSADGTGIAASFTNPYGVGVDAAGNVYVADANSEKIRKIVIP